MEKTTYDRYGLSGNPFRGLTSESLEAVDLFHVNQSIDFPLLSLRDEVVEMENSAIIVLIGEMGAGKTERLLLLKGEASRGVFCVFRNVVQETERLVGGIADDIVSGSKAGLFSNPPWLKEVRRLQGATKKSYDPDAAARAVAAALDAKAPSFLLLNDFHTLEKAREPDKFVRFLHTLFDEIGAGVLIMIGTSERYFEDLMADHHSLNERIHRKLRIPPLNASEACLMIAKRLVAKRLVEDLDPLYPFTDDSVAGMNEMSSGNPRTLLKLADRVIDHAAQHRVLQIDMDAVHAAIGQKRIERFSSDEASAASGTGVVDQQVKGPLADPKSSGNATHSKPVRQIRTLLTGSRWSKPAPPQDKMIRCECTVCKKSYVVDDDSVVKRCPHCGASQPAEKKRSLLRG
jgi:type II secretory pathway predicted ATPase ExeA